MQAGHQPFRLPDGSTTTIYGKGDDISVFQPASLSGAFEPHLQELFKRMVQPDWVCLDLGANIGLHSLYLASLAERVVAFEAAPTAFACLSANRAASPHAARLDIEELALWDEPTALRIAVPVGLDGCAYIAAPDDDATTSFAKISAANPGTLDGKPPLLDLLDVRAVRLDDWEAQHPLARLDLIKLDVEGSEPRVLNGAQRVLARYDPYLVTEFNPNCAAACFGNAPELYFEQLSELFRHIHVIHETGARLEPIASWAELRKVVEGHKFWTDLLCSNRLPDRSLMG